MSELHHRYQRQIALEGFGLQAQQHLLQAKVLVIGAGGLGCPVLQYLAAAGVGTLGIVDDDRVALSNLHRQVLYKTDMIGRYKVECAKEVLLAMNESVSVVTYQTRLTNSNVSEIVHQYDLVVDGSDNFATRYLVNDACVLLGKPLVFGAVSGYDGQVAVFNVSSHEKRGANYRDLFPVMPAENEVLNCAEGGVLGVLPGIIGTMMASEVIKLLTGVGQAFINQMCLIDIRTNQNYQFEIVLNEEGQKLIPSSLEALCVANYSFVCAGPLGEKEISVSDLLNLIKMEKQVTIVDVRELHEQPALNGIDHVRIPLLQLESKWESLDGEMVVLICQKGIRSLQAVNKMAAKLGGPQEVFSLKGGVEELVQNNA